MIRRRVRGVRPPGAERLVPKLCQSLQHRLLCTEGRPCLFSPALPARCPSPTTPDPTQPPPHPLLPQVLEEDFYRAGGVYMYDFDDTTDEDDY